MLRTRLGTDAAGRPVVRKEADAADAARVHREAAVLAVARHPGVVDLVGVEDGDDGGATLVVRRAGSRSALDLRPPVAVAACIGAALASTVADLHAMGVRHGRIAPEHVVLDEAHRPVLCGFAGAALPGEAGAPTTADDVAGIGEVLRALVGTDTELEPIPDRRLARGTAWAGATRRALLTIADQATADDPALRPPARALAASIAGVLPESTEPGQRHASPLDGRRARLLGAAAAAVGVVLVVGSLAGGGGGADATPTTAIASPSVTSSTTSTTVATDRRPEVVDAGARYAVGDPGDAVAVADWDCDGIATPAVVRPSSGEVFVFDGWGADVEVTATTVVAGAVEPVVADGCPALAVRTQDGREEPVR